MLYFQSQAKIDLWKDEKQKALRNAYIQQHKCVFCDSLYKIYAHYNWGLYVNCLMDHPLLLN